MTYDEMIERLSNLNVEQELTLEEVPHCSNLLYQLKKKRPIQERLFNDIVNLYIATRTIPFTPDNTSSYIYNITHAVNEYMNFYWPPSRNPFPAQADYTSSIIPEMLCLIFHNISKELNEEIRISAQKDLAIECLFDISGGGSIRLKNKRVDVAVFKSTSLKFQDTSVDFPVPLLAIECKTNLDKNMLSGIEQSVSDLKKTFPDCYYFVVTEVSDFDVNLNYASSGIDEIYVLREQKRGTIRRTPESRNPLDANLICEIVEKLKSNIDLLNSNTADLQTRMTTGKLIGNVV